MKQADHEFPNTRWSVVLDAQAPDSELRHRALERICKTYWPPIYAYARGLRLSPADAEDLTQSLFADLLQKQSFDRVDADRGKLRAFLMAATRNHARSHWRKAGRQKRGGEVTVLSLDYQHAEKLCSLEPSDSETPEKIFERNWGINLLRRTMERLEAVYVGEGKGEVFAALKDQLGLGRGDTDYEGTAADLGISEGARRVALHRLRKRYRRILREEIAQTLDEENEEAIEEEIRYLFGVFSR
ncbi:MAG: RNA polymerase sigma factor (sigma-70 family) [Verrucomicrobiales bacterium]|jgi:RNA polymerase sigma factor (sigma-70 family)